MSLSSELSFLETSALTGENVEEVFLKCTRTILTKIDAGESHTHSLVQLKSLSLLVPKYYIPSLLK